MNIRDNIRGTIDAKGMKQVVVAERSGFTEQQFSDMLNGRRIIRPCDVMAIAIALEVDVGDPFVDAGQESA